MALQSVLQTSKLPQRAVFPHETTPLFRALLRPDQNLRRNLSRRFSFSRATSPGKWSFPGQIGFS